MDFEEQESQRERAKVFLRPWLKSAEAIQAQKPLDVTKAYYCVRDLKEHFSGNYIGEHVLVAFYALQDIKGLHNLDAQSDPVKRATRGFDDLIFEVRIRLRNGLR